MSRSPAAGNGRPPLEPRVFGHVRGLSPDMPKGRVKLLAVAVAGAGSSTRRARLRRRRRGAAARARRVRDDARLRRPAVLPRDHVERLAAPRRASGCRAGRGEPSARGERGRGGRRARGAALRLYWTGHDARRDRRRDPARARGAPRARPAPRLAAARRRSRAARLAAPGRQVDELRGEHGRRGRGPAAAAPTTRVFLANGDVVLEAPISNIWWRSGDTLFTPSLEVGVLAGVTRATLLELAPAAGYRVERGRLHRSTICAGADEAFTLVVDPRGAAGGRARRPRRSATACPARRARALQQALRERATRGEPG